MYSVLDWSSNLILVGDIDCTTLNIPNPIGISENVTFNGYFDGNNKTIKNLKFSYPKMNLVGLFGINQGNLKNLSLVNCEITGNDYVGGLCGYNRGIIDNCFTKCEDYWT